MGRMSADLLRNKVAQYLEKHPEMAHELMIPSGFHQCLIRRFERYLGGQEALSAQDG